MMKALVVDDELEYCNLLKILLLQKGYEVLQCQDGKQAWQMVQQACESGEQVHLIITDWMVPGMEGPELIRLVRKANYPHYTFIILMTGRSSRTDILEGIQSGADDYLIKPFGPEDVLARIGIAERILSLERKLVEQKDAMAFMASYDAVTGLLNRRKLYELAAIEMARAKRQNEPVGLIMLDIDYFKTVNDRFGHASGDAALKFVADMIQSGLRPYDHAGRWGGEEFLVLLPGTSLDEAAMIAERLRNRLACARLILSEQVEINISASFGVTSSSQSSQVDFEKLVRVADQALYLAKNNGRNRVEKADLKEISQTSSEPE